jgi:hypothetical protein
MMFWAAKSPEGIWGRSASLQAAQEIRKVGMFTDFSRIAKW